MKKFFSFLIISMLAVPMMAQVVTSGRRGDAEDVRNNAAAQAPQHNGNHNGNHNGYNNGNHNGYGNCPTCENGSYNHQNNGYNHNSYNYNHKANTTQVNAIYKYIKGISFDSERLKAAKLIVTLCPISASDMATIMNTFSFESNKVAFLKAAYEYCYDPQNFGYAVNKLSFSSSRKDVNDYIHQHYRR